MNEPATLTISEFFFVMKLEPDRRNDFVLLEGALHMVNRNTQTWRRFCITESLSASLAGCFALGHDSLDDICSTGLSASICPFTIQLIVQIYLASGLLRARDAERETGMRV